MNKAEKIIHFANFNITFGEKNIEMLNYFCDVIYPAFLSNYKRGKEGEGPLYYVNDVKVKEIEGEFVLVGNYIKDTEYDVRTVFKDGKLISNPSTVPTAPYSRFIIFLKNHKMLLVRNESQSPDIRSFQATVRFMLNKYVREHNKIIENKDEKIPHTNVNIVDMHCMEDIKEMFKTVDKIKSVQLKFFPPNGDIENDTIADQIGKELKELKSSGATLKYTSPCSKENTMNLLERVSGFAKTLVEVVDFSGLKRKIKEFNFTSSSKIKMDGNIADKDDAYVLEQVKGNNIISQVSKVNMELYNKYRSDIYKLL